MPDEFEAYWSAVDTDLVRYPAAAELERLPLRCTDFADVFAVRLTSLGPYRIFGYLSVPTAAGRHPALLQTPHYGSVNHVPAYELRQRYVVLTPMHRGQRLADQPFAAQYPGLLTLGIDDPVEYAYRGIVADCLRGAEFLLGHPAVDVDRVGVVGDDLALLTAARRPQFAAVQVSALLLYRLLDAAARTQAYPIEEINDVVRHSAPGTLDAIGRTLAFFDPLEHASSIGAPTLLAAADAGAPGGPEWLGPLVQRLGDHAQVYQLSHQGRTDQVWLDSWLAARIGA